MRTCPRWRAWLLEAPDAWPITVLRFGEPARDILLTRFEDQDGGWYPQQVDDALQDAAQASIIAIDIAADVDPRTLRVRLEGSAGQVGCRLQ